VVAAKPLVAFFAALLLAPAALADDPTLRIDPSDQAWAARALLRASDFGPDWQGGRTKPSRPKGPDCPGFEPKASDIVVTGHANASFKNARAGVQVSLDVQLLQNADSVQTDFARTIQPKLPACLEYEFKRGPNNFESVHVERVDVPSVGSVSAHYRATIAVRAHGRTARVISDFLFFGHGRLEYSLNVVAPARYVPQLVPFELDMARILVKRAARPE